MLDIKQIKTAFIVFLLSQVVITGATLIGFYYTTKAEQQYQNERLAKLEEATCKFAEITNVDKEFSSLTKSNDEAHESLLKVVEQIQYDVRQLRDYQLRGKKSLVKIADSINYYVFN